MSTTIYHGFRCGTRDQVEAMRRIDRLGGPLSALAEHREQVFVTARAVQLLDQRVLARAAGDPVPALETPRTPWATALAELRERQETVRTTRERDPEIDTEVIITLWKTTTNGEWLGIVFADGDAAAYRLVVGQRRRGLSAYGYWNSTDDRPQGVTQRAWKQREQAWRGTRDRAGQPPVPRLSWTFDARRDPDPARALAHLPTLAQRLARPAEDRVRKRWYADQPPLPDGAGITDHMERYHTFRDVLREDALWKARHAEEKAWVVEQLEKDPGVLARAVHHPIV